MISNVHIIQVWNENNQNFRLGLAHRTSEKQRPGPLDLALLFQEVTRVKKLSKPSSSMRDLLMSSIQEYNRLQTNKSWRVTESDRKLVYNVIRCPVLLPALKEVADFSAWQHSCFTLENLDSDFYVPGTVLAPCNTNQLWKDLKVGHWNFNLLIFVDWNLFFVNSPWDPCRLFPWRAWPCGHDALWRSIKRKRPRAPLSSKRPVLRWKTFTVIVFLLSFFVVGSLNDTWPDRSWRNETFLQWLSWWRFAAYGTAFAASWPARSALRRWTNWRRCFLLGTWLARFWKNRELHLTK